jgi:hypothetical protein
MVAYVCNPSYLWGRDRDIVFLTGTGIKQDPISKITNTKKGWQSGSSVEHLSGKYEDLSSTSGATRKKNKACHVPYTRWPSLHVQVTVCFNLHIFKTKTSPFPLFPPHTPSVSSTWWVSMTSQETRFQAHKTWSRHLSRIQVLLLGGFFPYTGEAEWESQLPGGNRFDWGQPSCDSPWGSSPQVRACPSSACSWTILFEVGFLLDCNIHRKCTHYGEFPHVRFTL